MARQIGAVLGVAILVGTLGVPRTGRGSGGGAGGVGEGTRGAGGADAVLASFRHAWFGIAAVSVLAAAVSVRSRRQPVEEGGAD